MIDFERFVLDNGLRVLIHKDNSTALAAVNVLYDVGARDENPDKTGFAHLFEHLMFGGSVNIPEYDKALQKAGGENNAFTTNDITNYYLTVPAQNLEVGLWLEADRMLSLAFSQKSLDIQRSVVIEEFKQRYLNQPYGDVWMLIRKMAFKEHSYKWPTIGKEISHIENAKLEEVEEFFYRFYRPNNAILVIAGNVDVERTKKLVHKWFADIPLGESNRRNLIQEPAQAMPTLVQVERKVPLNAIFKVWHMEGRTEDAYYTTDLISDVLGRGKSSRFYTQLVKQKKLFSELDAFVLGSIDPGLFVVSGKLSDGVSMEQADKAIEQQIINLRENEIGEEELKKVKNKIESSLILSEVSILNKAMNLAIAELLGDAEKVNRELSYYEKVTTADIKSKSNVLFAENNVSTLYYNAILD